MQLKRVNIFVIISLLLLLLFIIFVFMESTEELVEKDAYRTGQMEATTIVAFRDYLAEANQEILRLLEKHRDETNFKNPFACAPAYVTSRAVKRIKGFIIRQVSDRPRNPKNLATGPELEAIRLFKINPELKDYFKMVKKGGKEYYFYAYPLRVEPACLQCHGEIGREVDRETYKLLKKYYGVGAFNYKEGEVRGILAVYIPKEEFSEKVTFLKYRGIAIIVGYILIIGLILYVHLQLFRELKKFEIVFSNPNKLQKLREVEFNLEEFREIQNYLIKYLEESERYHQKLKRSLITSPLTQLKNLKAFSDFTKSESNEEIPFTVVAFDVDNFRDINQTFGFRIGNKLVRQIGIRLEKLCQRLQERGRIELFHLDVDRFAIVVPLEWSREQVKSIAYNFIRALEEPYSVTSDGEGIDDIVVSFRAGVAYRETTPLPKISFALEEAKKQRREVVFYDEVKSKRGDYRQHLEMLRKIRKAIYTDNGAGIVPFYQGIVDRNRRIVKYEALVRLLDLDEGKIVSPFFFLKVAKSSKLYTEITKIMVRKVLEQFREKPYGVSLNLSVEDAENREVREYILEKVKNFPEPHRISFEIVEDEYAGNSEDVKNFFRQLKELGCKIYIDDFGSGYANFEYLIKLNADGVKIDGSLIKNILHDKGSEVTVKSVISFTKEMGMESIGEFVENEEIFLKLRELGVDYFQGYYFSKPSRFVQ